jgi:hypothetical protein
MRPSKYYVLEHHDEPQPDGTVRTVYTFGVDTAADYIYCPTEGVGYGSQIIAPDGTLYWFKKDAGSGSPGWVLCV